MTIIEDIADFANYSGINNGFRHIIADNDNLINFCAENNKSFYGTSNLRNRQVAIV